MTETAVDVATVAAHLNLHPQTVYAHAKSGLIPGFRVGRAWRFYLSQIDARLSAQSDPWARTARGKRRAA